MKTLLCILLLSSTLCAELYQCKSSLLRVEANTITLTTKDGKIYQAKRSYGAFCYDFEDKDRKISICLQKNGDTFTWSTSEGKRTEKCMSVN